MLWYIKKYVKVYTLPADGQKVTPSDGNRLKNIFTLNDISNNNDILSYCGVTVLSW